MVPAPEMVPGTISGGCDATQIRPKRRPAPALATRNCARPHFGGRNCHRLSTGMALEHSFTFPLPNGLHARPASALEEVASTFRAAVTLVNERTGQSADAT